MLIGISALNAYRYEYIAQGELSNFTIRIDRLGGKPCYIPFTHYGAQLAAADFPKVILLMFNAYHFAHESNHYFVKAAFGSTSSRGKSRGCMCTFGGRTARPSSGLSLRSRSPSTSAFPDEKSVRRFALYRSMQMTSAALGTDTSPVEVTNVSRHGFWVLLDAEVKQPDPRP